MQQKRITESIQKLYGREEEFNYFNAAYKRARIDDNGVEIVFIGGVSGSGKSVLVEKAFANKKCLWGCGKYHQQRESKPLSALINALSQICESVSSSSLIREKYNVLLKESMHQDDMTVLARIIPKFLDCVHVEGNKTIELNSKEGLDNIKFSLRRFLRTVALAECPTVIFVDDLQWACATTLDIFGSILSDADMKNMIFVGSFRDNEIKKNSMALEWMEKISDSQYNTPINKHVSKLYLGNLSVPNINEMLSDLLRCNIEDSRDLAILMENRTNGNSFHILQLLDHIQAEGLLEKDIVTLRWKWELTRIKEKTTLSDNVVEIVTAKMKRLPCEVRLVLKIASCLGFRFNESILHLVKSVGMADATLGMEKCIQTAINEGLLERLNDDLLKFVHDKVFQVAFGLIADKNERDKIHFDIGFTLWQHFLEDKEINETGIDTAGLDDRTLFLCANQMNMNMGSKHFDDNNCWVDVSKLNLQAAKKAAEFSALLPSIAYLKDGLAMLERVPNPWANHYKLSLELNTLLVEMLYATGQLDRATEIIEKVIANATSSDDMVRVFQTKVQIHFSRSEYRSVVTLCLKALDKLGEHLQVSPTKVQQMIDFQLTKMKLDRLSDDEVLALPPMKNKKKIVAMDLLTRMIYSLSQLGDNALTSLAICRAVNITLQYGLAPTSFRALNMMAILTGSNSASNIDNSFRLCKLSRDVITKLDAKHLPGSWSSVMIMQLRQPLSLVMETCFEDYEIFMRNGYTQEAFFHITMYFVLYFYSGLPLDPLLNDMKRFTKQMQEYGQHSLLLMTIPNYQCVLNLTGNSDNPTDMYHGTAINLRSKLGLENKADGKESIWSFLMQIAYYCSDMKLAREMSDKLQAIKMDPTSNIAPFYQTRIFFFALIAIWYFKDTGKQKYKREAMKHIKKMRGFVKQRMINCVHKLQILEAELQTIGRNHNADEIQKSYNTAISAAARSGFLQDAAVANYIAGMHFAETDNPTSERYILQSHKMYSLWGAKAVVKDIESRFPSLFDNDKVSKLGRGGSGFRARQRFDDSISRHHQSLPDHVQSLTHNRNSLNNSENEQC